MDKCEAARILNLLIERGQDRTNEALKIAINALLENPEKEVKGRWIRIKRPDSKVEPIQCNICNKRMYWTGKSPKFCPHCGTKMESK